MGNSYGYRSIDTIGQSDGLSADGQPIRPAGGITVDWASVAARTGSDVTWPDGVTLKVGYKGLRRGQVLRKITASGKWGPHDPAAADGREATPSREDTVVLDESVLEESPKSDHPPVLVGGLVFKERLLATSGVASLAAGPTYTALLAALPELRFVQ